MSEVNRGDIEEVLEQIAEPCLSQGLITSGVVKNIAIRGDQVDVAIVLAYPAAGIKLAFCRRVSETLESLASVAKANVSLDWQIPSAQVQADIQRIDGVKNVVAVASGKGGVGKSTTSVNIALALAAEGAKVGILDADIYGPSQQLMLGIKEGTRPAQHGMQFMRPVSAHGIQSMSMAYLVTDKTPMVWRGPMASGALIQLLTQTAWDDLDYLIIDMPPGTGDIQLTLAQKVPVTGALIVTTPQDIALLDAKKGIEMFHKVGVPVLGVVENMAVHTCSECGHSEHIFGDGGGSRIAQDYGVEMMGALPLALSIRQQTDQGLPTVVAEPEGEVTAIYRDIARKMAAQVSLRAEGQAAMFPDIQMSDD
ncbi:ATP-binding protein involved in chromosome partitioning [Sinobacterium caligoides]|uniref:Iron-sulfur cluster carrier protein n=1 Tax=Sinobacterium caligoides TaxID=933926 RepID=A0A3N2E114_9GAMM|nr:iron-sulfur cluster carrier protein ApbC [Sinobacterium caligoides]ROS05801.1 ATP-binding protein involved in chromosome partitioning [Sinobacterium caligoides]